MQLREIDILLTALSWRKAGRKVAVCTVVAIRGSAPKGIGSHLVVDDKATFAGSVSGGCVEGDVIAEALEVIDTGRPRLMEFGYADEIAWKAGLSCGGDIKVYVEPLDETLEACLTQIVKSAGSRQPIVLVTSLDGEPPDIVALDRRADHSLRTHLDEIDRTGKSLLAVDGDRRRLLTAFIPPRRLVVVGAVHIAQALAAITDLVNLKMIVIDPRSAFATPERFPDIELFVDWPEDIAETVRLTPSDAFVALSHDPKIDDPGLRMALEAECFYVGALGSRRSHAQRLERLRSAGLSEADLQRIHGPVGLDIGAEGSAEIAIAIIAEVISSRRAMKSAAEPLKAA